MHLASPGELVKSLSEVLGLPLPTIVVLDRALAATGLRSKGGRGRSAAKVTARDAANLLMAVLAGGKIKDSAEVVERYAGTRPQPATSNGGPFKDSGIKELMSLPGRHSFVDAVEALLAAATFGSLAKVRETMKVRRRSGGPTFPEVEVVAHTPEIVGDILLSGLANGKVVKVRYTVAAPRNGRGAKSAGDRRFNASRDRARSDLDQSRRVSRETIIALAEALADQGGTR